MKAPTAVPLPWPDSGVSCDADPMVDLLSPNNQCALSSPESFTNSASDCGEDVTGNLRIQEIARQAKIARQAEIARQARKKDLTNQLNQAEAKVLRLQKELIATTKNVSKLQSDLATM
jgi:hypothetical protein